jgi:hypothetical protein
MSGASGRLSLKARKPSSGAQAKVMPRSMGAVLRQRLPPVPRFDHLHATAQAPPEAIPAAMPPADSHMEQELLHALEHPKHLQAFPAAGPAAGHPPPADQQAPGQEAVGTNNAAQPPAAVAAADGDEEEEQGMSPRVLAELEKAAAGADSDDAPPTQRGRARSAPQAQPGAGDSETFTGESPGPRAACAGGWGGVWGHDLCTNSAGRQRVAGSGAGRSSRRCQPRLPSAASPACPCISGGTRGDPRSHRALQPPAAGPAPVQPHPRTTCW